MYRPVLDTRLSTGGGGVKEKRLKRKAAKRKNKKQFIDHKTRNVKDIIGK